MLHTGNYSWVEVIVNRDVENIKKGIDSILKPLLLTDSVSNLNKSELLKNVSNIDIYMNAITTNLSIVSQEYKDTLKQKLTETLQMLE